MPLAFEIGYYLSQSEIAALFQDHQNLSLNSRFKGLTDASGELRIATVQR